ncbi:MAG: cell wall hydrolase [Rhodospirillales bacterium]|nr:cell wall hydrolase [Rhodospirillales bacterium]
MRTRSFPKLALASILSLLALGLYGGSAAQARTTAQGEIDGGRELKCLALNIYFEARSEPEAGKFAVGHVVMNRVANKRFPKSICRVIRQGGQVRRHRCQFSWWCDGKTDQPRDAAAWDDSKRIAEMVYTGISEDPTDGALWYHADYVKPNWRSDFQRGPKIGRHVFYAIEDMKRKNGGNTAMEASTFQVAYDSPTEITTGDNKFEISGKDFSKSMLMVFGIGLIGLGMGGLRRKSSKSISK